MYLISTALAPAAPHSGSTPAAGPEAHPLTPLAPFDDPRAPAPRAAQLRMQPLRAAPWPLAHCTYASLPPPFSLSGALCGGCGARHCNPVPI